ncbi:MAG: PRK06851 family protein [Firmicutes bacterium]|jgi:GTPase SAR1 family protein|nr:PRK06851 family protein [Bacillota bacterium]
MTRRKGNVKRVFPGNNTPRGFYSFYDHIITPDATRILVIKGGPGAGKSTFMQKIAEAMVDRGFDAELHHCSSDNESLDGVVFPEIGVALIDGTAPHIVDPKHPGAVDEIIHLGDYWDEAGLRKSREDIIACTREVARCFERAYRFLRAAKAVYDDWEAANLEGLDFGKANKLADDLIWEVFGAQRVSQKVGRDRHLFASAITPDGLKNYLDTIVQGCRRKYVIVGDPGTGKSVLLGKVARAGIERGYDVELYHCPLNPEKIEHVVIGGLSVALVKSIEPHTYEPSPADRIINMNDFLSEDVTRKYADLTAEDSRLFDHLFGRAITFIQMAKAVHDKMETYYTPCMDFAGITALRERTLERILGYADEARAADR